LGIGEINKLPEYENFKNSIQKFMEEPEKRDAGEEPGK
jgi:hypothetical protein